MHTHIRVLGWLHLALGLVDLLLALAAFGILAGVGALMGGANGPLGFLLGGVVASVVGGIMALTALPNFLAGWGLLEHRNWARWLALILGALNFFKFPWGTAVGVYTFVILLDDDSRAIFGAN